MDQLQIILIIFNILVAIVGVLAGFMLKSIYDAIKELRERIDKLPGVYRRRDDSTAFEVRIEATLVRIEGKLDKKADKQENIHSRESNRK